MAVSTLFHVLKSLCPNQAGGISLLTGVARFLGPAATPWSRISECLTVTSLAPSTGATLTIDQIAGGLILFTPTASITATLPTAALVLAAFPKIQVGHAIRCTVKNLATTTYTITLAAGSNGTLPATDTWVLQPGAAGTCNTVTFLLVMTAVGASPTYTCRSMGLAVS